jgi:hypothetical protein
MNKIKRRKFLKETAAISVGITGLLNGSPNENTKTQNTITQLKIPLQTIAGKKISRLIIGGNPFSFNAHSEPIIYSRELFKHYFTHEKVVETLQIGIQNGIDTFLGRIDDNVIGFLKMYEKISGTKMPWIAQTSAKPNRGAKKPEILVNIKRAADNHAMGIYFQGESADFLVKEGKIADIFEYVDYIRRLGKIAGVGAHDIRTIEACEKAGLKPDFYMKTFNKLEFCCPEFDRTKEVMAGIDIPWIAFKVLAAGRMHPEEGFEAALEIGAEFLCVGMFDFQVEENVKLFQTMV